MTSAQHVRLQAIEAMAFAIPVVGSMAATLIGSALVFHRRRTMWLRRWVRAAETAGIVRALHSLRRTFETTVNISLNTLHSARGKQLPIFRMRTLREAQLRDLIPSEEGCAAVLRAARQTSPAFPFVILPQSCAVLVKNFILNVMSPSPPPVLGRSNPVFASCRM